MHAPIQVLHTIRDSIVLYYANLSNNMSIWLATNPDRQPQEPGVHKHTAPEFERQIILSKVCTRRQGVRGAHQGSH